MPVKSLKELAAKVTAQTHSSDEVKSANYPLEIQALLNCLRAAGEGRSAQQLANHQVNKRDMKTLNKKGAEARGKARAVKAVVQHRTESWTIRVKQLSDIEHEIVTVLKQPAVDAAGRKSEIAAFRTILAPYHDKLIRAEAKYKALAVELRTVAQANRFIDEELRGAASVAVKEIWKLQAQLKVADGHVKKCLDLLK